MKTNFTSKNAKAIRTIANMEHKGMNAAIRTIKSVWESDRTDLSESIKAAQQDGLTIDDFCSDFILTNLAGTKWVSENGKAILTNKKGQMVAKATWTPGQVVDYVRRANAEKIRKANKAEKAEKANK